VKNYLTHNLISVPRFWLLVALLAVGFVLTLHADTKPDSSAPKLPGSTNSVAAPAHPSAGNTGDDDDNEDNVTIHEKHHGVEISTETWRGVDLVPIIGILATFGTPVLIVFFVCYFKYKRHREHLLLAQEFLKKGLPVPPQLLDESQNPTDSFVPADTSNRCSSDFRRGFKLTFIGLGVSVALYVSNHHSTIWAWGLIPMIMGIGYLISAWIESRQRGPFFNPPKSPPSSGNPL
jgi:hypothetical protein